MHKQRISPGLSSYLDAARWISACAVLIYHTRHVLFGGTPSSGLTIKIVLAITSFGDEAVIIFFVISGFLVGGLSLQKVREHRFETIDYVLARTARIYVVLIPAIVLGWLLDVVAMTWLADTGLYNKTTSDAFEWSIPVASRHAPEVLAGNLLMLQGSWVPAFGSNPPLWSLACEWWYYCAFAAAVQLVQPMRVGKIVGAVTLMIVAISLSTRGLLLSTYWILGMGLAVYIRAGLWRPPLLLSFFLLFAGLGVASGYLHSQSWGGPVARTVVAIGFSATMLSMAERDRPMPLASLHTRLADFSYSLYVIHMPVVYFIFAVLIHENVLNPNASLDIFHLTLLVGVAAFLLTLAWVFAILTEARTQTVRAWLTRRIVGRSFAL